MLKKLFDKLLMDLHGKGIERRIFLKYFGDFETENCVVETKPIAFRIVSTLFKVLIFGCSLAIVILPMERLVNFIVKTR